MKYFKLIGCFFVLAFLCWTSSAQAVGVCLLDGKGGRSFGMLDCSVKNSMCGNETAISLSSAAGVRINNLKSMTPIDEHGFCRFLDNNSEKSFFVPFMLKTEWSAFLSNVPSGITTQPCARPFVGQNLINGLHFGPTSAKPGMGDTGAVTADVSLPYWRTGDVWPLATGCTKQTKTFNHSCFEEVSQKKCWKMVQRTCSSTVCTETDPITGQCMNSHQSYYNCSYCGDWGSICVKKHTNWSETRGFSARAKNSDDGDPSWIRISSPLVSGSATRPNAQCTDRCNFDGHDCTDCGVIASTTTCIPTAKIKKIACPSGQTGEHKQKCDFTCPAAKWGVCYDITNTCTGTTSCTPAIQNKTLSCPSGQTGTLIRGRSFTCPAAKWGSWKTTSNTCQSSSGGGSNSSGYPKQSQTLCSLGNGKSGVLTKEMRFFPGNYRSPKPGTSGKWVVIKPCH